VTPIPGDKFVDAWDEAFAEQAAGFESLKHRIEAKTSPGSGNQ
jgi:hypothetical protein